MAKQDQPYIGIDLGGTNIQAGVMVGKGELLARDSTKTKAELGTADRDTLIAWARTLAAPPAPAPGTEATNEHEGHEH